MGSVFGRKRVEPAVMERVDESTSAEAIEDLYGLSTAAAERPDESGAAEPWSSILARSGEVVAGVGGPYGEAAGKNGESLDEGTSTEAVVDA